MIKLGKKLRKNGVALDVIVLGDIEPEKKDALSKLVETANKDENSHFLCFGNGGLYSLAESVRNSEILINNVPNNPVPGPDNPG